MFVDKRRQQEPLVALGTSACPAELMVPPQPCCSGPASSFHHGQDQNVVDRKDALMPVEHAHCPGSQLLENSVSQPLPQLAVQV